MRLLRPFVDLKRRLMKRWDGDRILRARYREVFGRELDTGAPTFTEMLYARMIDLNRDGNPLFSRLTDKYAVREWVRERIGDAHLTPLLWVADDPRGIPFAQAPLSIAKTSHGWGGHVVLRQPVDAGRVAAELNGFLRQNYYWLEREAQYDPIKPRILVEPLLSDGHVAGPLDYRHWCFDGEVALIQLDNNAHDLNAYYDTGWNKVDVVYRTRGTLRDVPKPANLARMVEIASTLSRGIDFVRVDLYNLDGDIRFGEMTFTPSGGAFRFQPEQWEVRLGQQWADAKRRLAAS